MSIHIFHFLITDKIINNLQEIKELKQYSISKKMNYILSNIDQIIRYCNILNIDERSKVENFNFKKNFHLYLDNSLFKRLKYYHGKFNFYSIALLVRMILKVFIKMERKYGFKKVFKILKKHINNLKKICTKNKKLSVVQLKNYLGIKYKDKLTLWLILDKLLF